MKFIRPVSIKDTGTQTRSTTGTYFDNGGTLHVAAIDESRLTYEPLARLLVEPSATNLLAYSEDFTHWSGTATLTSQATYNGINFALLTNTITNSNDYKYKDTTITDGSHVYAVSTFLKKYGSDNSVKVYVSLFGGTSKTCVITVGFSTPTATVYSGSPLSCTITRINTNLYKLVVYVQNNSTGNTTLRTLVYPNYQDVITAAVASAHFGGVQVELWIPTSYIPTTSAAASRAGDVNTRYLYSNIQEPDQEGLFTAGAALEYYWDNVTSYVIGNRVALASTHKVYECAIANTNNIPSSYSTGATPKWLVVGATNKWNVFDEVYGTQSYYPNNIILALSPKAAANSIALLNIVADLVTIIITEPTAGTAGITYTDSLTMTGKTDYIFLDLPITSTSTITIELSINTGFAKIGKISIGNILDLGYTQFGVKTGIQDYSTKTTDIFGNTSIVKRTYSKRMSAGVIIDNTYVDTMFRMLAYYRSTPLVWIAADNDYTMMIQYGYYQSFEIDVQFAKESYCTLEIIGLT